MLGVSYTVMSERDPWWELATAVNDSMNDADPWAEMAKAQHDLKVAVWDDALRPRLVRLLEWLCSGRAVLRCGLFFGAIVAAWIAVLGVDAWSRW